MKPRITNSSFRTERIGIFYKTEHFLHRQWARDISDEILRFSLLGLDSTESKLFIIVSRKIVKKHHGKNIELFILIRKRSLITCFFEKIENFQSQKKNF